MLAHRIRIEPTSEQRDYFARAAGTARRVWNWALAEWKRQTSLGFRPNGMALKKQFNAIKYTHSDWLDDEGRPWLRAIHRDAHAQPFSDLTKTLERYFAALKSGKSTCFPKFKKKGSCRDNFYVANDRIRIEGKTAVLPKVGRVVLSENLRFPGVVVRANVSREADHWFLAVQIEVPDNVARRSRKGNGVVGVDLGISAAVILNNGEKISAPRPLRTALRRLRIRNRKQSRKIEEAKRNAGITGAIPKGTRLPTTKNQTKGARSLARLHARIAHVRKDFLHKLTTQLCRENQAVAIEDLCVKGMLANKRLARGVADIGFYEFRRQLQYKALRYGTKLVVADRWYPSSKLCSGCGRKHASLQLHEGVWTCVCGACHDRDVNAAVNLQRFATGALVAAKALPEASFAVTLSTVAGQSSATVGKVTPVRHEYGHQDGSGREEDGAHSHTSSIADARMIRGKQLGR